MTDTNDGPTAESTESETRRLTVSRVIEAPAERVYQAFVDPDELGEWMHPPGVAAEVHHLAPEVGGSYRITMRGTGDAEFSHTYAGTYRELVPGERIVQVEAIETDDSGMAAEVRVEIGFEAVDDGTEVTVAMTVPADWPDDGIAGWEAALGNLAGRLEAP